MFTLLIFGKKILVLMIDEAVEWMENFKMWQKSYKLLLVEFFYLILDC